MQKLKLACCLSALALAVGVLEPWAQKGGPAAAWTPAGGPAAVPSWQEAATSNGPDDLGAVDFESGNSEATGRRTAIANVPRAAVESDTAAAEPAWAVLLERLRSRAQQPDTFHTDALEEVDALAVLLRAASEPAAATQLPERLHREVIENPEESPLVRGAVLIAAARDLADSTFRRTLDGWFQDSTTPRELLRSGAIAAARRGQASPCPRPLRLAELSKLQIKSQPSLPGFFALKLDTIVGPYEAAILEQWLERPHPMKDLFRIAGPPPTYQADPNDVGDYFVTAELIFALWGHRSLEDPHVESRVLQAAQPSGGRETEASLIYFRPASLVVFSLSLCSEGMFDVASTMGESKDKLLASMAREMASLAGAGPLGVAQMAKIEALRYEHDQNADLIVTLVDVGNRMASAPKEDALLTDEACLYLDGLVQDAAVDERARAAGLVAIRSSGSWDHFKGSAAAALYADAPDVVSAIAASTLAQMAREQPHLRDEVVEILLQAKSKVTKAWLLADLESFLTEFS